MNKVGRMRSHLGGGGEVLLRKMKQKVYRKIEKKFFFSKTIWPDKL